MDSWMSRTIRTFISDIQRQNPIELIVAGLAAPLAAAVILSGGHLELGPLKVMLPAIGEGIAKLRRSLLEPLSKERYERKTPKSLRAPNLEAAREAEARATPSANARPKF
jgi:hypothetical protein